MTELSRRALLTGMCGIAALSMVPMSAEAANLVKKLPKGRLSFKVSDAAKIVDVGSSVGIGQVKGQPAGLFRSGPSTFSAFSLACPHQGVTVEKNDSGWVCSAHDSKFAENGALEFGPATTALRKVPVKVKGGVVTIG
jgi:Rieske Fe-S protein